MVQNIYDAVYGCLIAGAIGDALGAPTEGMYYQQIREKYGCLDELITYDNVPYSEGHIGSVTDDTTLRHYMCLAIISNGGRITPDDAADIWIHKLNPDRFWSPDQIAYLKMKAGVNPWDAGRGNIPSACATMSMTPIGIINAGNPRQAYQDGYNIAAINGDGFNREAPATLAAGIAAAFDPDATVDGILQIMTTYASPIVSRAIDLVMNLAHKSDDINSFKQQFYEYLLDWWSRPSLNWNRSNYPQGTAIETVPLVMAVLYLCDGDVNQCLIEGANFGRDADAISSLSASIAGAMQGASAIQRQDWITQIETANRAFFEEVEGDVNANFASTARRMVEALRSERARTLSRLDLLDRLLG